ncbi:MAG: YbgF trimerization domain-containing protein, partial [Beijerinckiaceae bacterium]
MILSRIASGLSAMALIVALAALPARAQDAAELLLRIDRLESLVRQMNGQVEQVQNQNRRLEEQVRRFQSDTDFRFKELGQGRGTAPAAPAATPARPQRSDSFDPAANPNATGAPQPLGSSGSASQPRPPVRQVIPGTAAVANP